MSVQSGLNELVHKWVYGKDPKYMGGAPDYSGDIQAAWDVLWKIARDHGDASWHNIRLVAENGYWECILDFADQHVGQSPEAPEAICRAALKAAGCH